RILGKEDAPVTIVEYASLTCPHCASFHANVLPTIKKDYVETGKVRFVFRDFPLDGLAVRAAMVAHCAGPERYYPFLDVLFASQAKWARSQKRLEMLGQIATLGGMSQQAFDQCMANKSVEEAVIKSRFEAERLFEISSTPTIIVNGDKFGGGVGVDELKAIIDAELPKS